jgi:hypothetical protein
MGLFNICLATVYFQSEDKFYQQKEGKTMGNQLSLVISNTFMEHLVEIALDMADHKPSKCIKCVDDTFMV